MNELTRKENSKRNILALLISPVVGDIVFLIAFIISSSIELYVTKRPQRGDLEIGFMYFIIFPIIFFILFIFQIIVLEPIYKNLSGKDKLNKSMMIRVGLIVISGFSFIFSLVLSVMDNNFDSFIFKFFILFIAWSFYFIPNMITYYLIYVRRIRPT